MRTKALLLSAAALAAGLLSSVAQSNVYSVNVVGYVNVSVAADKYAILSAPLNVTAEGGNNITNVVGGVITDGTFLFKFSNGGFEDAEQYFDGFGWFPGVTTLNPGDGFFVQTPAAGGAAITFLGEVKQGIQTNVLATGYSLVGGQVPQSIPLGSSTDLPTNSTNTFIFPAAEGDTLFMWDSVGQGYKDAISYFEGYGWFDSGPFGPGPVEGPSPAVAEGFFVQKGAGADWVRNFNVQP